ncbi:MAG: VOC family protein, partial [Hymenobacteraceae bacterium]|nr:VOC family protein [Hymenobacteraceae bacterium]MDX5396084.1 VOC family protein [Hymenobacteraceae bacterium]MDX5512149.1 VOC family protein [Hymenobacteraceae bacterium]
MKTSLDRIILLVNDFDEALKFYEHNFDCHIIFDQKTAEGKRFLHIGFPQKYSAGIWFLKAETDEQQERVGNQTGGMPTFVLYTSDLEKQYQRLIRNKVEIV